MKEINKRFIQAMKECISTKRCKSQKHFCSIMDIQESALSQLKSGHLSVTMKQTRNMYEIFGYSPTWIITGDGPKKSGPLSKEKPSWREALEIIKRELENK